MANGEFRTSTLVLLSFSLPRSLSLFSHGVGVCVGGVGGGGDAEPGGGLRVPRATGGRKTPPHVRSRIAKVSLIASLLSHPLHDPDSKLFRFYVHLSMSSRVDAVTRGGWLHRGRGKFTIVNEPRCFIPFTD